MPPTKKSVTVLSLSALLLAGIFGITQLEKSNAPIAPSATPQSLDSDSLNAQSEATEYLNKRDSVELALNGSSETEQSSVEVVSHNLPDSAARLTLAQDKVEASPQARNSENDAPDKPRLSPRVVAVLEEVQARQLAGQHEEALNELNALYAEFDSLSAFEQMTLLNFYSNTLLSQQMWQEAITAFSQLLTIPDLQPGINSRAILSLGQLHAQIGENETAIHYYQEWFNNSNEETRTAEQIERTQRLLATAESKASQP